jgi:hypothetical protein
MTTDEKIVFGMAFVFLPLVQKYPCHHNIRHSKLYAAPVDLALDEQGRGPDVEHGG